jgi:predicted nuclease of predicted toxin-antitoxin system
MHYYRLYPSEVNERLQWEEEAEAELVEGPFVRRVEAWFLVRLLLDEHINPEVARQLRRRGADAITLSEARMRGAGDEQVLAFASTEERVLVTYNIGDFRQLQIEWHRLARRHAGIVFVSEKSVPQRDPGGLVKALRRLLQQYPGGLADQALFLTRPIGGQKSGLVW